MKLMSFSGIDGAGKSTQIEALCEHFSNLGCPFEVYRFWDDVVTLRRFRENSSHKVFNGDRGIGSPDRPIVRRDKNVKSKALTVLRMCFYLLDAWSLRRRVVRQRHSGIIVFDRYIYDELANLPLESRIVQLYLRLVLRLTPVPDLAFLIDSEPETAATRKPEYPVAFVRQNRDSFIRLSQLAGMVVLPPGSIEETEETIRQLVEARSLPTHAACLENPFQATDPSLGAGSENH